MSVLTSTSGRLHSEFVRLLFLQTHREADRFFAVSGVQVRKPTVASSTSVARLSLPSSKAKVVWLSNRVSITPSQWGESWQVVFYTILDIYFVVNMKIIFSWLEISYNVKPYFNFFTCKYLIFTRYFVKLTWKRFSSFLNIFWSKAFKISSNICKYVVICVYYQVSHTLGWSWNWNT